MKKHPGWFCGLFLCGLLSLPAAPAAPPNILFIFADDQRADTIAALGNAHIQTPNLDRLVRRGIAFNRAYMQGGMNGATCVPSRAMLLSGRSLFRIDEKLTRDETWPAAFGRAGYATFISGKWHNTPAAVPLSFQRAQSLFTGGMTNPMKAPLGSLENGQMGPTKVSPKHACETFADETIAFLLEAHAKPFFAYLAFDGPHDPHIVPDDFPVRYDPEKIPLPANFLPQHPFDNGEMTIRDEQLLLWPRTSADVRAMLADYYRYISYLDMLIGRVLDTLDASTAGKNTFVVFAADSGVARGSHGLIGKQNLYEHSVRVPLIVAGPGIPANQTTDAMCYLFDVLPSLGALSKVAGPTTSEGLDLTATLRDPKKPARTSLMFAYQKVQRALRDDRWKLIRYPQVNRTQLFDLRSDPHELTNLADRPEHTARVAAMTTALAAEMKRYDDPVAALTVENPKPAAWAPPAKRAAKSAQSENPPASPVRKAAAATVQIERDLVYAKYGEREVKLDLYLPPRSTAKKVPCIVVIHGGGWRSGDKNRFAKIAARLATEGFAAACIGYRLLPEVEFPAPVVDCKAAVRWVRAHAAQYGIDPENLGAIGGSAGGHLVAMLGTSATVPELEGDGGNAGVSSRVHAVVAMATPADMSSFAECANMDRKLAALISPVTHVSRDSAPILLLHGTKDALVPMAQSELLLEKYRTAGRPAELIKIAGGPHAFWNGAQFEETMTLAVKFFRQQLGGMKP